MYISFVGLRGNMIMEALNINSKNFIFHKSDEVEDFWEKSITSSSKAIELLSESVLLYTFSFLSNRLLPDENNPKQYHNVNEIKKFLDEHFNEHNLSLEKISNQFSYNKKYISHLFKKHFGIGIIEYLNTVRIQNACTMFEQGFASVSDVSLSSGYSDSQYFSKIFKAKTDMTPTQYISGIQNIKKE